MTAKICALVFAMIVLSGCTNMKPSDFSETSPVLRIEDYFVGKTHAWGIFEDRFGNLRRQFFVDIQGRWDGETLVLDERFRYSDGETDRRVWTIKKIDEHRYEGSADDVIGTATGESYGNALNWRYDMDLKVGESTLRVHFNDWMFLHSSGVLVNRARVSKFGIAIGEVTLFFQKAARQPDISAGPFNVPTNDDVRLRAASR
jgi:hypothetical protein